MTSRLFVLVATSLVVVTMLDHVGLVSCNGNDQLRPVWQTFRQQLFSNLGPDGGPKGVEQLLNRLKDILELNENTLEDGLDASEKVDTLLEACNLDGSSVCEWNSLRDLNELIGIYSFGPMPLHDYLEKCRQRRFVHCHEQLVGSVRGNFEQKLDAQLMAYLIEMKDSIVELSAKQNRPVRFPMIPAMTTHEGILDFLEQADQLPTVKGRKKFRREFRALVVEKCDRFLAATGPSMEILQQMLEDGWICEQMVNNGDSKLIDLLTVGRVCSHLKGDLSGHTKRMFKLAKERRKAALAENQTPSCGSKLCGLFIRNKSV